MGRKCKKVMLTHSEIQLVHGLIMKNKEKGDYSGRKEYFNKKQDKILKKLEMQLQTSYTNSNK